MNSVTPILPERKNSGLNLPLQNACSSFSGTTEASFTGAHGQGYENQPWNLR